MLNINYHSVWLPGDLRWAVNPIQTGVIFASCDRGVASEAPSLKLRNRSWKKKAKITLNNHFQKSNFFSKNWHNDVICCHCGVMLFNLLATKRDKTNIHYGLEKLSENRINGYRINLKWYKNKNKCYRSWLTVSYNVINCPKNNQLNWRRILNSFARP